MALIDAGEPDHEACRAELANLSGPMVVTWPVFTEAMYLLGDAGGWRAQQSLWVLVARGDLEIAKLDRRASDRIQALMEKYRDRPMSLADASLVAIAEARKMKRVFTLDSDFDFYRIRGRERFERVP